MSTKAPPLLKRGRGGSSTGFLWDWKRLRSAVSTRSDIVRLWRAASRLSWRITVSSMLSVVFIWKTIHQGWVMSRSERRPRHDGRRRVSLRGGERRDYSPPPDSVGSLVEACTFAADRRDARGRERRGRDMALELPGRGGRRVGDIRHHG